MTTTSTQTIYTITGLIDAVSTNLPSLSPTKLYLLEELAGEEYWHAIPKGLRTNLGQDFKALAISGELPVTYAGRTSSNKALYQLK